MTVLRIFSSFKLILVPLPMRALSSSTPSLPHLFLDPVHYEHCIGRLRKRFVDQSSKDHVSSRLKSTFKHHSCRWSRKLHESNLGISTTRFSLFRIEIQGMIGPGWIFLDSTSWLLELCAIRSLDPPVVYFTFSAIVTHSMWSYMRMVDVVRCRLAESGSCASINCIIHMID